MVYPQKKLWATKSENKPDLLYSRLMRLLVNPYRPLLRKKQKRREKTVAVNRLVAQE
jgi:hypothetical protein